MSNKKKEEVIDGVEEIVEDETKQKKKKKEKKYIVDFDTIKILVILEKWKVFTYTDSKKIVEYIESLPEDYNVDYVMTNDTTLVINKDYREIAPMVKYLVANVYKSLELRAISANRIVMYFAIFLFLILWVVSLIINKDNEILQAINNIKIDSYEQVTSKLENENVEVKNNDSIIRVEDIEDIIENNKWSWEY